MVNTPDDNTLTKEELEEFIADLPNIVKELELEIERQRQQDKENAE